MKCRGCEDDKPSAGFYTDSASGKNRQPCRVCTSLRCGLWRAANKKRVKVVNAKYLKTDRGMIASKRSRQGYRKANPEKATAQRRDYRSKNPEKARAHNSLNKAVASGRVTRPSSCETCGASGGRIEGHHPDYSKPLSVEWMCSGCHSAHHAAADTEAPDGK